MTNQENSLSSAESEHETDLTPLPPGKSLLIRLKNLGGWLKENKKKLFWWWVAYQCVKGILTTSLIWIPLFYMWWHG